MWNGKYHRGTLIRKVKTKYKNKENTKKKETATHINTAVNTFY